MGEGVSVGVGVLSTGGTAVNGGETMGKFTRISVDVTGYPDAVISATEVRLPGAKLAGTVTQFTR